MNKIDKLDKELEKAREKAAEWQAKIRELEKQKQEEENSQIVQAVRSLKLTPAQLMACLLYTSTYELIQMLIERNNLHEVDTWMFFKWVFKTFVAVMILTNTFNIRCV